MSADGHQHHAGCHDHGPDKFAHDLRGTSRRDLTSALVLISAYMIAEVIGGYFSGSLALIADAGHMLTDAASIGLALIALHFSARPASARRTFGYRRLEILAAQVNAVTLWLIAAWVVFEAYHRFADMPDVKGEIMLSVGSVGLVVNLVAAWILHRSAGHSVNVEGAYQHVLADLLGSIGVVISGILVWAFDWKIADPILSVIIGILILVSSWRLLRKVIHVLLEGVPQHVGHPSPVPAYGRCAGRGLDSRYSCLEPCLRLRRSHSPRRGRSRGRRGGLHSKPSPRDRLP